MAFSDQLGKFTPTILFKYIFTMYPYRNLSDDQKLSLFIIDHFRYIKIHTWLRGLGELNKRNVLFITEPQDDFFCFIPPSLATMYEF